MKNGEYPIKYEFIFKDNRKHVFKLNLDPTKVVIIRADTHHKPDWTRLEHNQCQCCTLKKEKHPYCPVAVNIADLVEEFKNTYSYDDCTVRCITPERTYSKETTLQEGLFSIFGIIMPTSNCPVMKFFKPMARFHLPFSTIQETIFRSTSAYLLRQYFERKRGEIPDLDLKKLDEQYEKVQKVNAGILARIRGLTKKSADADNNAIIILDALAQMLSSEIEDKLHSLEYLFSSDS